MIELIIASLIVYIILVWILYSWSGLPSFSCFMTAGLGAASANWAKSCTVSSFGPMGKRCRCMYHNDAKYHMGTEYPAQFDVQQQGNATRLGGLQSDFNYNVTGKTTPYQDSIQSSLLNANSNALLPKFKHKMGRQQNRHHM